MRARVHTHTEGMTYLSQTPNAHFNALKERHGQFLSFYRVSINTELGNTGPFFQRKIKLRFLEPLVTSFFTNKSIYNLVLCVFLFKETLVNIYHGFINIELTANNTVTQPERSPSNTHIFPIRHITAFSHLGTQESTLAQQLGAILNDKSSNKKHKKCRKHVTKQIMKKTLVCSLRAEVALSGESHHRPLHVCGSVHVCKCPQRRTLTGGYRSILASR